MKLTWSQSKEMYSQVRQGAYWPREPATTGSSKDAIVGGLVKLLQLGVHLLLFGLCLWILAAVLAALWILLLTPVCWLANHSVCALTVTQPLCPQLTCSTLPGSLAPFSSNAPPIVETRIAERLKDTHDHITKAILEAKPIMLLPHTLLETHEALRQARWTIQRNNLPFKRFLDEGIAHYLDVSTIVRDDLAVFCSHVDFSVNKVLFASDNFVDRLRSMFEQSDDTAHSSGFLAMLTRKKPPSTRVSSLAAAEYAELVGVNTAVVKALTSSAVALLRRLRELEEDLSEIGDITSDGHRTLDYHKIRIEEKLSMWHTLLASMSIQRGDMETLDKQRQALFKVDKAVSNGIHDLEKVIWWLHSAQGDLRGLGTELLEFPKDLKQYLGKSIKLISQSATTLRNAS